MKYKSFLRFEKFLGLCFKTLNRHLGKVQTLEPVDIGKWSHSDRC